MSAKLTLEQFRETREDCDDLIEFMSEPGYRGYIYDGGSCYICLDEAGEPYLVIYNQQWVDKPLAELEEILYNEFYCVEIEHA